MTDIKLTAEQQESLARYVQGSDEYCDYYRPHMRLLALGLIETYPAGRLNMKCGRITLAGQRLYDALVGHKGIDLTLFPDKYQAAHKDQENAYWFLAYDRITIQRDYRLYCYFGAAKLDLSRKPVCQPKPVPAAWRVDWYGDEGIERRTHNPYGEPITYIFAGELHKIPDTGWSPYNTAALAFCKALPADTVLILWWH